MREDTPGPGWVDLFERAWPSYKAWFLREGLGQRPGLAESRAKLAEYMPELVPVWERLAGLAAECLDDPEEADLAARMLSLYRPPRFLTGCSQAVWTDGGPVLVRNYDFHPRLFEGTVFRSTWAGAAVMATSDCLWGALDGINSRGLCVALAFGGRREVGEGFGIPLILRYVLETCATVEEAAAALRGVPSHMPYNVSMLDRSGAYAVAYLRPGRPARVGRDAVCTNHQPDAVGTDYARATASVARKRLLSRAVHGGAASPGELLELFLEAPLYMTGYEHGHGTLYTVAYRPETGQADFRWPDLRVEQALEEFESQQVQVALG